MQQSLIGKIKIADYDYPLPDTQIAKHPLAERASCRLLVSTQPSLIKDTIFSALPDLLPSGGILVRNNTRVINARIHFIKESGAKVEVFLLEPLSPADYQLNFASQSGAVWSCLVGNLKRWKDGPLTKKLVIDGKKVVLSVSRGEPLPGNAHSISFEWSDPNISFAQIVEAAGRIPIPPYLKRESEQSDASDYQTVYAHDEGSVAAPTAGLHFTPELISQIEEKGVEVGSVTLHVGAGTFQPVKSETIGDHPMHTEFFSVSLPLVEKIISALPSEIPVTAVGTTTVRTLESLPFLGRKIMTGDFSLHVSQWEAYEFPHNGEKAKIIRWLEALRDFMKEKGINKLTASTAIMIAPGFKWGVVTGLITNFHQPQSTLLLLVSSFLGENPSDSQSPRWRGIYDHALKEGYRFLSYGDACYFERPV